MDELYNLPNLIAEYKVTCFLSLMAPIGFLVWAARRNRPKEDPAHKGCSALDTVLYTGDSEFIEVTILLHDREEDKHPYLLVKTDGEEDVRVPYEDILVLNLSDNTQDPKGSTSGFGIDYTDFTGEARLIFVQPGSTRSLARPYLEIIKASHDRWSAGVYKRPVTLNDESYKKVKRSLVRRSA